MLEGCSVDDALPAGAAALVPRVLALAEKPDKAVCTAEVIKAEKFLKRTFFTDV